MLQHIHWIRPYYLLALIPLLFVLTGIFLKRAKGDLWRKVCDPHLLSHLLIDNYASKQLLPLLLLAITWIGAVLALAGPSWQKQQIPVFRSQRATVIALSLTPSLYAADVQPNRLTRAKYKIQDILLRYKEGQIGLVTFSSEAFVVSPLTDDAATISSMVPVLDPEIMPVQGNDISSGLKQAAELIQQGGMQHGEILLISDSKPTANDYSVATQLSAKGIKISVLAIGTEQGAPLPNEHGFVRNDNGSVILSQVDTKALQQLASEGKGRFSSFTNSDQDIAYLLQAGDAPVINQPSAKQKTLNLWQDQGYWLVLALLPFAALAFRRGWFETLVE